jgi:uncharacterized membrane protein
MTFKDIRKSAILHLQGNWGIAIMAMLIANLISSGPTLLIQLNVINTNARLLYEFFQLASYASILLIPVIVGYTRIHLDLAEAKIPDLDRMYYAFKKGKYAKSLLALFLMSLFQALWFLLLIIPGIIKSFAYALTPYILADPDMDHLDGTEPITRSRELMDGHKMEYFLLILSFTWWIIPVMVGALLILVSTMDIDLDSVDTFITIYGIIMTVLMFIIMPFVKQVTAEFYVQLKGSQERAMRRLHPELFAQEKPVDPFDESTSEQEYEDTSTDGEDDDVEVQESNDESDDLEKPIPVDSDVEEPESEEETEQDTDPFDEYYK